MRAKRKGRRPMSQDRIEAALLDFFERRESEDLRRELCRRADEAMERIKEAKKALWQGGEAVRSPGRQREMIRRLIENRKAYEAGLRAAGRPLLVGWKEIATAVGNVSVRTAQRWEAEFELPVSRLGKVPVADPEAIRQRKERQVNASDPLLERHTGKENGLVYEVLMD
jgi:hypothetical protein